MNKEYAYSNGKAIIVDEEGNQTKSKYYDNLDDILVQENLIEDMENKIKQLEEKSDSYKGNKNKRYIPLMLLLSILGILISNIILMAIIPEGFVSEMAFGNVNLCLFFNSMLLAVLTPMTAISDLRDYKKFKDAQNTETGMNSELDYLKKQITIEKQKLEKLQKDKKKKKENKKFGVVVVDDKAKLAESKSNSDFYYNVGYNENKYFKYYQQGRLNDKLQKDYNDAEIKKVEEYLEEKGPKFLKKHNKNIK